MRLLGKSAVIYGANSPAGASVAKAFAKEGATVFLAGRSTKLLQPVAREILQENGAVEVAQVDPLDSKSVSDHLHQVVVKHGRIDVSLNLAFMGVEGAARLCNLSDEQFAAVTFTRVRSNFVTAAAAASEMAYQGRGHILATAVPERPGRNAEMAGQAIGSAAIQALLEQVRIDVGSFGVDVAFLEHAPAGPEDLAQNLIELFGSAPAGSSPRREATSEATRTVSSQGVEASEGTAAG